jgi:hypothetical protein
MEYCGFLFYVAPVMFCQNRECDPVFAIIADFCKLAQQVEFAQRHDIGEGRTLISALVTRRYTDPGPLHVQMCEVETFYNAFPNVLRAVDFGVLVRKYASYIGNICSNLFGKSGAFV